MKPNLITMLGLAICLSIASCQANIRTATPLLIPSPTLSPSTETRFTPISATEEPTSTAIVEEPTLTATTEALTSALICFAPDEILPIAFMPDNVRFLVRASSSVQIFNLHTGEEEDFLSAQQGVFTAALSPDGQTLAWSLEDNTIQLIRLSDHELLATLTGHKDVVYDLRFSPTGDRLFSASHDGWVRIWDATGNQLSSIEAGGEVLGIGISPDGTRLAIIPGDGPMQLWDLIENKKIAEYGSALSYDTSDAVFSPDGQYLAADLATGLFLWRVSDGKLLWEDVKNSMAVVYSPDGRFLAYSDIDDSNKIVLASPDGGRILRTIAQMQAPVWEMFFSPDSSLLAATDGIEIKIWRVDDGKLFYVGKTTCP